VALHAQSHIDADEAQAYEELLGLHGQRVGVPNEPFTVDDLAALPERPSAVVVELPLRRGGFVLPSWDGLQSISSWCRAQRVPLHFDGARLWESCPGYGRSLAEVAALADSVYVSFYKGLGGLGGCVLAGSADFIERVKPWKNRLAGNLYTVFPFVLSAQAGLDRHLPRMPEYHARAMALAQALSELGGVTVYPQVPGTNAFQLHLAGDRERLQQGLVEIARTRRFWLGWRLSRSFLPGCSMMEISIGDAADGWHDDEVVEAMDGVLRQSRHV
jgi:threonine aldolase